MHGSPPPEPTALRNQAPAAAGLTDLLLLFCGRRLLMRVEGHSMEPALNPQDRVVVKRWKTEPSAPIGQIVVALHPHKPDLWMIKRLRCCDASGFWLEGDNPGESTDSRQLGWIDPQHMVGVVVGVFPWQRSEEPS
ncbi:MAG: nickel-type superoxide dismutase maturation protease [Synechococcus sp.]